MRWPCRCLIQLDLNVDARGKLKLHQSVHRLIGRIDDIHQSLVGADFVLIPGILIDMRRDQDREAFLPHRLRNGTLDRGTCAPGSLNDLTC